MSRSVPPLYVRISVLLVSTWAIVRMAKGTVNLESGDVPACDGDYQVTNSLGVISDGSGPVYPTSRFVVQNGEWRRGDGNPQGMGDAESWIDGNRSCSWLIQPSTLPTGDTTLFLDFLYLDTEDLFDFVTVYEGTSDADPQVGSYSGDLSASLPRHNTTGGAFFVTFYADASYV